MDELAAIFGPVTVKVRHRNGRVEARREDLGRWRDMGGRPSNPGLIRAGENHVRSRVHDLIVVGSRPTVPPPCHTEAPSA
jgi:hypothetical protein